MSASGGWQMSDNLETKLEGQHIERVCTCGVEDSEYIGRRMLKIENGRWNPLIW